MGSKMGNPRGRGEKRESLLLELCSTHTVTLVGKRNPSKDSEALKGRRH